MIPIQNRRYYVDISYYESNNRINCISWFNRDGQKSAPADIPTEIEFYISGNIKKMTWRKVGKIHRDNDRPAHVVFKDNSDLEIIFASWYREGKEHRDGHLPSCIKIDENDGRVCVLGFYRHGKETGINGLPYYIWINPDGSTEDDGGHPIEVDLSMFHGRLPRPPVVERPPFLTLD